MADTMNHYERIIKVYSMLRQKFQTEESELLEPLIKDIEENKIMFFNKDDNVLSPHVMPEAIREWEIKIATHEEFKESDASCLTDDGANKLI